MFIINKYIFYLFIIEISNIYKSRKNIIGSPHSALTIISVLLNLLDIAIL